VLLFDTQAPAPITEGLQLNARPSRRYQQQQQQETPDRSTAISTAVPSSSTPLTQQQQQQQQAGGFQQTVLSGDNQAVKVSLNDCLACSGCVTSAETVLLQAQSLKEFVAKCDDPDAIVVVSISPQSRASLAGGSCSLYVAPGGGGCCMQGCCVWWWSGGGWGMGVSHQPNGAALG
jgi:hypothetical protein